MLQKNARNAGFVLIIMMLMLCPGCGINQNTLLSDKELVSDETSDTTDAMPPYFTYTSSSDAEAVIEDKEFSIPSLTLKEEIIIPNEGKVSIQGGDNVTYIYLEKGNEQIELAKFDLSYDNYHLESFEDLLGFSGFKFFVKSSPPYNAEVIYVALVNGKTKMILENHALYKEKTNKFTDEFQYEKDVDNDGIEEIISNIYYPAGGGSRAMLYDVKDNDILSFDLTSLLPDSEEYYYERQTDLQSWYDEEIDKVVIEFRKTQELDVITKEYEIKAEFIKMEKSYCRYISDELKDYGKDK